MSKSQRLRLSDARAIFRLVGECRELGADSKLWRQHMLTQLLQLTGGQVGMAGPVGFDDANGADRNPAIDLGWQSDKERNVFLQFLHDKVQYTDPFLQAMGKEVAKLTHGKRQITMQRGEFVDDATWYRSVAYCEYRRVSRVDDSLISIVKMTSGELHAAMLMRSDGESPFELRDRRMLHLFLSELSRLPDHELAPPGCEPISRLSKRLRHVLACLLEGDSEQQVANRLQLTRDTTHQYVKELYRLHNVHSRPELMAQFVRFPIQQLRAS